MAAMTDATNYINAVMNARGNNSFVNYSGLWLDPNDSDSQGLIYTPDTPTGNGGSVPEASTVYAAALLLAPLGFGICRSLRRNRSDVAR
jgi:hypothetical protein